MATASSSLLLASPSPLSIQFQSSSSHLSFSRSQNLRSPVTTSSLPSLSASSSSSISSLSPTTPSVYCGRGDRKTAKGKRFSHSFGNARPRSKKNGRGPPRIYAPPDLTKKDKIEDKEAIKIDIEE
ncbi:small ribosomal subunit protein bTHXc [Vicia villosa]|uniref:small ribosomal subunit protein bTHXc n=1 Tax=Vicia villosa TaxID=3911 RepID=UPI00273CD156|nr:small ribosomal subunit protein bTHXc [Vicia villosa]